MAPEGEPMSHALEGTPKPVVTLTEQANSRRIGRSMFIGHTAGYVIVFLAISIILNGVRFSVEGIGFSFDAMLLYEGRIDLSTIPPIAHLHFLGGNLIVSAVLFAAAVLVSCDLIVRRRHDRGRSGVDGLIWMALLVASQITYTLSLYVAAVWLDLLVYAGGLYLFVVLVILPGNPGENRYGAVPRPD
jgi:uncharacterized membrane protein YhaH (DUF805 family)